MRLLTWNIRHGGRSGAHLDRVIDTFVAFAADVVVVTEFRSHEGGTRIRNRLAAAGYQTTCEGVPPPRNSVLVACRGALAACGPLDGRLEQTDRLWCVSWQGLKIVGVYMPNQELKHPYWAALLAHAGSAAAADIYCGDFNTGRNDLDREEGGTAFIGAEYMDRIVDAGYIDVWRHLNGAAREYSWYSNPGRRGFRLDHLFARPLWAGRARTCRLDHVPRLSGLSDHSVLVAEFDTPDASQPGSVA